MSPRMLKTLNIGDTIQAAQDILNDGSFPTAGEDEVLVPKGSVGMIIDSGHLQDNEEQVVYLVKFQCHDDPKELGPPIGCWPEDIEPMPEAFQ